MHFMYRREAARKSRLRWFGHVQRMNEARLPELFLNAEANGMRGDVPGDVIWTRSSVI